MDSLRNYPPNLLLAILFLLMLALAAIIEITGSSIATRILVILIPFGGVVLGIASAIKAERKIETIPAITLILSGFAATTLAVIGAGPFSNKIVDVIIIGSIAGIQFNRPLQVTIRTARRLVG